MSIGIDNMAGNIGSNYTKNTSTYHSVQEEKNTRTNKEITENNVEQAIKQPIVISEDANEKYQEDQDKIKKAIESLNKNLRNTECKFGVHDETNRVVIRIVDKETKEVIKELPPEKTLEMISKVWELAGIMVDEKL